MARSRQSDSTADSNKLQDEGGHQFPTLLEECSMILKFTATSVALIVGVVWYVLAIFGERTIEASAVGVAQVFFIAYLRRRTLPAGQLRPDVSAKEEYLFFGAMIIVVLVTTLVAVGHVRSEETLRTLVEIGAGALVTWVLIALYRAKLQKLPEGEKQEPGG